MSEAKKEILLGDCLELMKQLPENSVDAIVTDPPYGLEFMGKDWDKGVPGAHFWEEMIRVLKPGGHLLAFSGTRTYHRMASAIEDAGFGVRDMIEWVYGSGFPKSLNIGKAVDKLQGNEREVTGLNRAGKNALGQDSGWNAHENKTEFDITKGTSEYEGWGTALKPAHEPICMARKPLAEKTVAENCLKWGTGGINIDESRVEGEMGADRALGKPRIDTDKYGKANPHLNPQSPLGRFPANLIHDNSEEVRECFPETKSGGSDGNRRGHGPSHGDVCYGEYKGLKTEGGLQPNSGNASRFFKSIIYQAKASKKERNAGCESNGHPTVKPVALMEYLINMITPKGGVVLDPFGGSGTTAVACLNTNRQFIIMEMQEEYVEIIKARVSHFNIKPKQQTLFGDEIKQ